MEGMNCSEARQALWPPERPRLAEAEVLEARRHVQGCPSCESYLAQDRALLAAYDRASLERDPLVLREGVFDALARERSRGLGFAPTRLVRRRWVVAVVAASVAGLFAEDYLRRAVSQAKLVSSDAAEIGWFLTRELGRPIRPLQVAGLSCVSAEICLIEGWRGAMIQYIEGGRKIYHYVIPQEGTKPRDPEAASMWASSGSSGGSEGGGVGGPAPHHVGDR